MAAPLALVLLLMIHRVYGQYGPGVSYGFVNICALKGSTVTMSCAFYYPSGSYVMRAFWTTTQVREMYGEYPDLSEDPEYSQRIQYLGDKQRNCYLRLRHATKKDEREYYCRFTTNMHGNGWIGIPRVRLSVTDLQLESPERVTEGDSVRLTCRSSCELTETPTFIWYRNSEALTEGRIQNYIVYSLISRGHAGHYSCGVQGQDYTSPVVYLNVRYSPNTPVISINEPAVIMSGDSVTLSCSSDSNPPAEIKWFKGETLVGSRRIFSISNISSDDSKKYRCNARNEYGEKYSAPVNINIQKPPRRVSVSIRGSAVIMEGDLVSLSCSSDSNPPAQISWFKGETFVRSGRVFSISKISSDDSGEYKCRARNKHGEKYSDPVTINVVYPPRSVSVSISGSAVIMSGDSVTLMCTSDSNPPALSFSWFKENQSSAVGSGQSFSAVQSGRFYCEAHNPHGAQRSDAVTVTVHQRAVRKRNVIIVASGGILIIVILFIFRMKRMSRRSAVNEYENVDLSANTYAGLDLQSRPLDLYNTLSTPSPAAHQTSSSEYANLSVIGRSAVDLH